MATNPLYPNLPDVSNLTTANSTPNFVGTTPTITAIPPVSTTQVTPPPAGGYPGTVPVTVNVAPPVASPSPSAPTKTSTDAPVDTRTPEQRESDAFYKSNLSTAVSGGPVDSTVLNSGVTPNAVVSTADTMLQEYLKTNKEYQSKILGAITPSSEELALRKKLAEQKSQANMNQETALNSGETTSFAGGEAQRVARTDALKTMAIEAQVQTLQDARQTLLTGLKTLMDSNDGSAKFALEIEKYKNTLDSVEKDAQTTYNNNLQSHPDAKYTYDPNKSWVDNLTGQAKAVALAPSFINKQFASGNVGEYQYAVSQGYKGTFEQYQAKTGAGKGTAGEREASQLEQYAQVFTPGATYKGTPVIDVNGYVDPMVWKEALASFKGDRASFIKKFGYLVYNDAKTGIPKEYGLTPVEQKLIKGVIE